MSKKIECLPVCWIVCSSRRLEAEDQVACSPSSCPGCLVELPKAAALGRRDEWNVKQRTWCSDHPGSSEIPTGTRSSDHHHLRDPSCQRRSNASCSRLGGHRRPYLREPWEHSLYFSFP